MFKAKQAFKTIIQGLICLIILGAVGGYERDQLSLLTSLLIIWTSIILNILISKEIKQ